MPSGYVCPVLHAHLPFVRHPEHNDFLEEDWLYEGITETYLPLLEIFRQLERDGVDWRLTMTVTPTLAAMFEDELLQNRYLRAIDNLIALAEKEVRRTRFEPEFQALAKMYLDRFVQCRHLFVDVYNKNLLGGFRHFFESGKLELITCCATHGFLPLMKEYPKAVRVQIEQGAREFARHFGRRPKGIWLAECGYYPGVDRFLADAGIRYFFTDTHGVVFATPRPRFGVYAPIFCPGSGVAALGRDTESSRQVWSSIEGYPGDYTYREFYRDVGFDLPEDYLKPHMHEVGVRTHLGIKYFAITGKTVHKRAYDRATALRTAAAHAGHFLDNRVRQVQYLNGLMDRPPLIVAPYDAELFGHWWYEGPEFINFLLRKLHYDQDIVKPITVPEYLKLQPVCQVCLPLESSWGAGGFAEVWLNPTNDWIYPHLHECSRRMSELAERFTSPNDLERRALTQAARELLLAQSSDWAFIMKTGTVVEYAHKRTRTHVDNFHRLHDQLLGGSIDEAALRVMEERK